MQTLTYDLKTFLDKIHPENFVNATTSTLFAEQKNTHHAVCQWLQQCLDTSTVDLGGSEVVNNAEYGLFLDKLFDQIFPADWVTINVTHTSYIFQFTRKVFDVASTHASKEAALVWCVCLTVSDTRFTEKLTAEPTLINVNPENGHSVYGIVTVPNDVELTDFTSLKHAESCLKLKLCIDGDQHDAFITADGTVKLSVLPLSDPSIWLKLFTIYKELVRNELPVTVSGITMYDTYQDALTSYRTMYQHLADRARLSNDPVRYESIPNLAICDLTATLNYYTVDMMKHDAKDRFNI